MESKNITLHIILQSVMFVFFFQLLTDLLEAIYMLDLLNTSLSLNVLGILALFSPILMVSPAIKRRMSDKPKYNKFQRFTTPQFLKLVLGAIVLLCRLIDPLVSSATRIPIAGIGVGMYLLYFFEQFDQPISLYRERGGQIFGTSLLFANLLLILFRTLNSTLDISMYRYYQVIGWVMVVGAGYLLYRFYTTPVTDMATESPSDSPPDLPRYKGGRVIGLLMGVFSILTLIYFTFESPTVFSRWTEGNYTMIIGLCTFMMAATALLLLVKPGLLQKLTPRILWIWNGAFLVIFLVMILIHRVSFPTDMESLRIVTPTQWYGQIPLVLMLLLSPIIFLDFTMLIQRLFRGQLRFRWLLAGFLSGGLYMVILIFMIIFTQIWGYVEELGSNYMRNMFWLPFLLIILGIFIPMLLTNLPIKKLTPVVSKPNAKIIAGGVLLVLFLGSFVGALLVTANPTPPSTEGVTTLTIMAFNNQMGVNETGDKNYDAQLQLIREIDPDIIGFPESETAKIGTGNSDVMRYFADKLGYYTYYGPTTITGTYGTALLSRYPLFNMSTVFSYSDKDEIGTTQAQIQIGDKIFTLFVCHPAGSDDAKLAHIEAVLYRASGMPNVIAFGDFNWRPNSLLYNMTTAVLEDTWIEKWPTGVEEGQNITKRIDYVFVAPGFTVDDARHILAPESQTDHPVYWATISW
jgi:endonuclease/exonuclease/phosphatase family metal-dependent hydrolase